MGQHISELAEVSVEQIVIGERARKNAGDLAELAASIERVGLLHPLVLNSRHELIAGGRRLAAVKKLGWKEVPCRVVATLDDALAALQAERDENTCREPLAIGEMVALGEKIEALEKPKAQARQEATRARKGQKVGAQGGGKLPPRSAGSAGKTRDKVAAAVGVSGKTLDYATKVVKQGVPELAKAVDDDKLSVSAAAKVADLPADTQREIVNDPDPKAAAKAATSVKVQAVVENDPPIPAHRRYVPVDEVTAKVTKRQLVEDDLSGPARARLIQGLEGAKTALTAVAETIDGLRAEKLNPLELPRRFGAIAEQLRQSSDTFAALSETPVEDLSSAVLQKYTRAVHDKMKREEDEEGISRLGAAANLEMLRKLMAK